MFSFVTPELGDGINVEHMLEKRMVHFVQAGEKFVWQCNIAIPFGNSNASFVGNWQLAFIGLHNMQQWQPRTCKNPKVASHISRSGAVNAKCCDLSKSWCHASVMKNCLR